MVAPVGHRSLIGVITVEEGDDGDEEEETDEAQREKNSFTSRAIEGQIKEGRISGKVRSEKKERSEEEGSCEKNHRKKEVGRQAEPYAASGEKGHVREGRRDEGTRPPGRNGARADARACQRPRDG